MSMKKNTAKVLYLDKETNPITGGQKYNQDLLNVLQNDCKCQVTFTPSVHEAYKGQAKVLIPFKELKWLKEIKKSDYVFFGDTSFRSHFLLLLCSRLFTKAQCVAIVHHYSYLGLNGVKRFVRYVCERIYNSLMNSIIYPNPYIYEIGSHFFPSRKIAYIPTHIRRATYTDVSPQDNQLLFVGTIEPRKGLHYLLQSIEILKKQYHLDVKLFLAGKIANQEYYNRLVAFVENNGLKENISFLGRVSDEQLVSCYKKAAVFVFPSLLEGYGLSLVEAMQYGLPVVAFNNSAMPYTVKDGVNGYLVENENSSAFADSIAKILQNKELREQMHKGAYKTIESVKDFEDFRQSLIDYMRHDTNN